MPHERERTSTYVALYVGWHGWHAFQDLQRRGAGWTDTYRDDVGFTLIALFDGFVIMSPAEQAPHQGPGTRLSRWGLQ